VTQKRQRKPIHERRPQKLPGIGKLYQREESDLLKPHSLDPQPSWNELEQHVQWQTGGETSEDADQHAPVQDGLFEALLP